jgi:CheY-like chemotaxis protein
MCAYRHHHPLAVSILIVDDDADGREVSVAALESTSPRQMSEFR